jgi:hypothetical protein
MRGRGFDQLAIGLTTAGSRRAILRLLASVWGPGLASFAARDAAARCRPYGGRCRDGDRCCNGNRCKRGRCRCPRGFPWECDGMCYSGVGTCCDDGGVCFYGQQCCPPNLASPHNYYCCPPTEECCETGCCA